MFLYAGGVPLQDRERVQIDFSEQDSEIVRDALKQSRTWNRTQIWDFRTSTPSSDEPSSQSKKIIHVEPADNEFLLQILNSSTGEPKFVQYSNLALAWIRSPPGMWTCCHAGYETEIMPTVHSQDNLEIINVEETSSNIAYTVAGETLNSMPMEGDSEVQIVVDKSHPPRVSRILETSIDDPDRGRRIIEFRNMGTTSVERPDALPEITYPELVLSLGHLARGRTNFGESAA